MKRIFRGFLVAIFIFFVVNVAFAATYKIDPEHSTVSFKIRHLFSSVTGTFDQFEGKIEYDPASPQNASVNATIEVDSIDTNVEGRDKHLKTADFFDVEKYPTITFTSTGITEATENSAKLDGVLNMHGVEKPVTLDVKIHGVGKDPWGNTRAGFSGTTKLNRKDFGLTWNKALESGQVLVGDDVEVALEIEGILES